MVNLVCGLSLAVCNEHMRPNSLKASFISRTRILLVQRVEMITLVQNYVTSSSQQDWAWANYRGHGRWGRRENWSRLTQPVCTTVCEYVWDGAVCISGLYVRSSYKKNGVCSWTLVSVSLVVASWRLTTYHRFNNDNTSASVQQWVWVSQTRWSI